MAYPPPNYPPAYPPPAPYYRPPYNPYMQYNPYMAMRPPMAPMPMPYPPGMMPMSPMMVPPGAVPVSQGPVMSPVPTTVPATPTDAAPPISISPTPSTEASVPQATPRVYQVLPQGPSSPIFVTTPGGANPGCGCGASLPDPTACTLPGGACTDCLDKHAHDHCCGWYFDVTGSADYLRPFFQSNPAMVIQTTTPITPNIATADDFDWKWTVSPRISAEVIGPCGLGVRAEYFRFYQDSDAATFIAAAPGALNTINTALPATFFPPVALFAVAGSAPGTTFVATSNLKVETIDLDAIYNFKLCHWLLTLEAGGRYLDTQQNYQFQVTSPAGTVTGVTSYHQSFSGAGPLLGFEFHRYIGCTGLAAFGKIDGALLVGTGIEQFGFVVPGTVTLFNNFFSASHNPVMPVTDIELGAEYTFNHCGKFHPFVRASVIDQTYFDAGNASSRTGNLSLFGGQVTGGFAF
jgi:hypothetical protein